MKINIGVTVGSACPTFGVPGIEEIYCAVFEKGLEMTRRAQQAGVKIMAGTDASDSY